MHKMDQSIHYSMTYISSNKTLGELRHLFQNQAKKRSIQYNYKEKF
jgi:hypothetical protein